MTNPAPDSTSLTAHLRAALPGLSKSEARIAQWLILNEAAAMIETGARLGGRDAGAGRGAPGACHGFTVDPWPCRRLRTTFVDREVNRSVRVGMLAEWLDLTVVDAVVLFDITPCAREASSLVRLARQRGAEVLVVTDALNGRFQRQPRCADPAGRHR
jgi:hypothetical protein